jgi:hypothetical protein
MVFQHGDNLVLILIEEEILDLLIRIIPCDKEKQQRSTHTDQEKSEQ